MIDSKEQLLEYLSNNIYDAVVIEGYDGVGKGSLLNTLAEFYDVVPYRPDYNLWQQHDHRPVDRWKISGFFWDVYSHFEINHPKTLLFDRGVISGAVYNHDRSIAKDYVSMLGDNSKSVLHILVCCTEEDYYKFQESRGLDIKDIETEWVRYLAYTAEYRECFEIAGVDYITYYNHFSDDEFERLSCTCEGCGHYNYGICRHPSMNCPVDKGNDRCLLSYDIETQDKEGKDGTKVYSL